jgi:hypothetical protein
MSTYIKPQSVDNYLSGICHQLKPLFPDIRKIRKYPLVVKTLIGCKKRTTNTVCKHSISHADLIQLASTFNLSTSHNDLLFLSLVTTAFHSLLRLGELVWPDTTRLQDYRKVVLRHSVAINGATFQFQLPGHKAD